MTKVNVLQGQVGALRHAFLFPGPKLKDQSLKRIWHHFEKGKLAMSSAVKCCCTEVPHIGLNQA